MSYNIIKTDVGLPYGCVLVCMLLLISLVCALPDSEIGVRLVGGATYNEGRVEVYIQDHWGSISDFAWDNNDAEVICRQLGFPQVDYSYRAVLYANKPYGEGPPQIIEHVECDGSEVKITSCSHHDADEHDSDGVAGVVCFPESEIGVRLVGGSTNRGSHGRVEIYYSGEWVNVCGDGWDENDAHVVCRQLGFMAGNHEAADGAQFDKGTGQIWLYDVMCVGTEINITHCLYAVNSSCDHSLDAAVICQDVRLVGGPSANQGRVEIYHNGQYGTLCDDEWDATNALVICQQLGYTGVDHGLVQDIRYVEGSDVIPMWLDEVNCNGSESHIADCSHEGFGIHNCYMNEYVGVICTPDSGIGVRLIGGSVNRGRVEVYYKGEWGTVCGKGWDDKDAQVVCLQLGFPQGNNHRAGGGKAEFGEGVGRILMSGVHCEGTEDSIDNCLHDGWGESRCEHDQYASVVCVDVRLVGGSSASQGRVEVYFNSQWGSVCDDEWDNADALVICRQLGYPEGGHKAIDKAWFGEGSGQIWLDDVMCNGSESDITSCPHEGWGVHDCESDHTEDAGVICIQGLVKQPSSSAVPFVIASLIALVVFVVAVIIGLLIRRKRNINKMSDKFDGVELDSMAKLTTKPTLADSITIDRLGRDGVTLLKEIGHGAFGVVYKAALQVNETKNRKLVAVKLLKAHSSETARKDFLTELHLYETLDYHPNVISMISTSFNEDPMYLILEFAPNGNLKEYLDNVRTGIFKNEKMEKRDSIASTELLNYGYHIAAGMAFLCTKGCVHRDLAARNILLGDNMVCKISDFGLARDLAGEQQYEMKSSGRVPIRWMSPESVLHNLYTTKSDVWSFGILMWEVVTLGAHPYPGMSAKHVINQVKQGYRLPKPEHCSDEVYTVMTECWNSDADMRPGFDKLHIKLENMLTSSQGYLEMSEFDENNYVYTQDGELESKDQSGESSRESSIGSNEIRYLPAPTTSC